MTEISYPSKTKFEPWRMWVVQGLLAVVFLVYGFRLFSLQVINGDEYIAKANENRISQISVPTQRGSSTIATATCWPATWPHSMWSSPG